MLVNKPCLPKATSQCICKFTEELQPMVERAVPPLSQVRRGEHSTKVMIACSCERQGDLHHAPTTKGSQASKRPPPRRGHAPTEAHLVGQDRLYTQRDAERSSARTESAPSGQPRCHRVGCEPGGEKLSSHKRLSGQLFFLSFPAAYGG